MTRQRWIGLVSLCAVLLMLSPAMNVTVEAYTPKPSSDPIEPDPAIAFNVTKDDHRYGWGIAQYEDDANAVKTLAAEVDDRVTQPYNLDLTNSYAPGSGYLQEHKNLDNVAATCSDYWNDTNANCWAKTETGGGTGTLTASNVKGVGKALRFKTVGAAAAISDTLWKYDIVDLGADFAKYRLIIGVKIYQLDAAGQAKVCVGNSAGTQQTRCVLFDSAGTLWQNTTGFVRATNAAIVVLEDPAGQFLDFRVNDIGGGAAYTPADIATINVQLLDTDASPARTIEIGLVALAVKTTQFVWGTDSLGNTVANQTLIGTRNLATFAPTFTYNEVRSLKVAMRGWAHNLVGNNVTNNDEEDTTGDFVRLVHYRFDYKLPKATDLTYANAKLQDALRLTKDHFKSVTANGVDKTTLYTCTSCKVGTSLTLIDPVVVDTTYSVLLDVHYTEAEWNSISTVKGGLQGVENSVLGAIIFVAMLVGLGGAAMGLRRRRASTRQIPPR